MRRFAPLSKPKQNPVNKCPCPKSCRRVALTFTTHDRHTVLRHSQPRRAHHEGAAPPLTGTVSVTNQDLLAAVNRLEDKIDDRFRLQDEQIQRVDLKVSAATARLSQIEGAVSIIKWIGPAGLAALLFGVMKGMGLL